MLKELQFKDTYNPLFADKSDYSSAQLAKTYGNKLLRAQESSNELTQLKMVQQCTYDTGQFIPATGYYPQYSIIRRHALINASYAATTGKKAPPIYKRRIIEPKVEKAIIENFEQVQRLRQPLLEHEQSLLEIALNDSGFSARKITALPFEEGSTKAVIETFEKMDRLQRMLGVSDPYSATGLSALAAHNRARGGNQKKGINTQSIEPDFAKIFLGEKQAEMDRQIYEASTDSNLAGPLKDYYMYGNGGGKVKEKTDLAKFVETGIANVMQNYQQRLADPNRGAHPGGVVGVLKEEIAAPGSRRGLNNFFGNAPTDEVMTAQLSSFAQLPSEARNSIIKALVKVADLPDNKLQTIMTRYPALAIKYGFSQGQDGQPLQDPNAPDPTSARMRPPIRRQQAARQARPVQARVLQIANQAQNPVQFIPQAPPVAMQAAPIQAKADPAAANVFQFGGYKAAIDDRALAWAQKQEEQKEARIRLLYQDMLDKRNQSRQQSGIATPVQMGPPLPLKPTIAQQLGVGDPLGDDMGLSRVLAPPQQIGQLPVPGASSGWGIGTAASMFGSGIKNVAQATFSLQSKLSSMIGLGPKAANTADMMDNPAANMGASMQNTGAMGQNAQRMAQQMSAGAFGMGSMSNQNQLPFTGSQGSTQQQNSAQAQDVGSIINSQRMMDVGNTNASKSLPFSDPKDIDPTQLGGPQGQQQLPPPPSQQQLPPPQAQQEEEKKEAQNAIYMLGGNYDQTGASSRSAMNMLTRDVLKGLNQSQQDKSFRQTIRAGDDGKLLLDNLYDIALSQREGPLVANFGNYEFGHLYGNLMERAKIGDDDAKSYGLNALTQLMGHTNEGGLKEMLQKSTKLLGGGLNTDASLATGQIWRNMTRSQDWAGMQNSSEKNKKISEFVSKIDPKLLQTLSMDTSTGKKRDYTEVQDKFIDTMSNMIPVKQRELFWGLPKDVKFALSMDMFKPTMTNLVDSQSKFAEELAVYNEYGVPPGLRHLIAKMSKQELGLARGREKTMTQFWNAYYGYNQNSSVPQSPFSPPSDRTSTSNKEQESSSSAPSQSLPPPPPPPAAPPKKKQEEEEKKMPPIIPPSEQSSDPSSSLYIPKPEFPAGVAKPIDEKANPSRGAGVSHASKGFDPEEAKQKAVRLSAINHQQGVQQSLTEKKVQEAMKKGGDDKIQRSYHALYAMQSLTPGQLDGYSTEHIKEATLQGVMNKDMYKGAAIPQEFKALTTDAAAYLKAYAFGETYTRRTRIQKAVAAENVADIANAAQPKDNEAIIQNHARASLQVLAARIYKDRGNANTEKIIDDYLAEVTRVYAPNPAAGAADKARQPIQARQLAIIRDAIKSIQRGGGPFDVLSPESAQVDMFLSRTDKSYNDLIIEKYKQVAARRKAEETKSDRTQSPAASGSEAADERSKSMSRPNEESKGSKKGPAKSERQKANIPDWVNTDSEKETWKNLSKPQRATMQRKRDAKKRERGEEPSSEDDTFSRKKKPEDSKASSKKAPASKKDYSEKEDRSKSSKKGKK